MSAIPFIEINVQKLYMDRAKENNLLTIKGKKKVYVEHDVAGGN